MLSCDSPSQIPGVLDDHDVAPDYSEESEQLGQPVPNVCHYLMIQNPLCDFAEGDALLTAWTKVARKTGRMVMKQRNGPSTRLQRSWDGTTRLIETLPNLTLMLNIESILVAKLTFKIVSVLDIYSYNQDDMGNLLSEDDIENEMLDLDLEKRNIRRALALAKQLESLFQRRKVLRRLFLHWLRCKDSEIAAEMTTFIEGEVTRMEILREEETRLLYKSLEKTWKTRENCF